VGNSSFRIPWLNFFMFFTIKVYESLKGHSMRSSLRRLPMSSIAWGNFVTRGMLLVRNGKGFIIVTLVLHISIPSAEAILGLALSDEQFAILLRAAVEAIKQCVAFDPENFWTDPASDKTVDLVSQFSVFASILP
jgi:hypothetical protein